MAEGLPPLTPEQRMRWDSHALEQWNLLRQMFAGIDADLANMDLSSPAEIARWQELHARERELRSYLLQKRAAFRGTIAAHFVMAAITLAVWVVASLVLDIL